MEEKKGIKESKELITGVFVLAEAASEVFKDGFQIADLIDGFQKINSDPEKKKKIEEALAGIGEVPAEFKDLDLAEGIDLGVHAAKEVPALIAAFSKEEPVEAPSDEKLGE